MLDQTQEVDLVINEETLNEETPTNDQETEGTEDGEGKPPKEQEPDYKLKFSESSREAQRLYEETKTFKSQLIEKETALVEKEAELARIYETLNSDNPEAGKVVKLEKTVDELKKFVLMTKESQAIDEFVKSNSVAEAHRETLKRLGRALPDKSYKEIWEDTLSFAYTKGKNDSAEEQKRLKAEAPERGKGGISSEPIASIEQLNKLPLEKRKEYFKKMGL